MLPAVGEHAEKSRGLGAPPEGSLMLVGMHEEKPHPLSPCSRHRWERLELSCCISLQRLTDPAKGVGCSHRARQSSRTHHT